MKEKKRYPRIGIRNKRELADRLSGEGRSSREMIVLINDVIKNFELYWHDNARCSEPKKNKYVRSAFGTPLGELLDRINRKLLQPYDRLIPDFIFGGVSGRNHIQANQSLLGKIRGRRLLSLDIKGFFETIERRRVFYFFHDKCQCGIEVSNILADVCTVPLGPKGSPNPRKTLGRGFATSPRLSIWCNLGTFFRINWKVGRMLKGKDPKIAIYVDDIGISASGSTKEEMDKLYLKIKDLLSKFDPNQPLPLNEDKKKNLLFKEGAEHLGLKLGRNKLTVGAKTRLKFDRIKSELARTQDKERRKLLIRKKRAYKNYKSQLTR